jgi:hypothetical protein
MRRLLAAAVLACLPLAAASAQTPVRAEQPIWSILAFNGADYSPTFAIASSDTIYILAGLDNFLSARKTMVYWWPITSEWKTDTDALNILFPGALEVVDAAGQTTSLRMQDYTYFNARGEYELNWKVAVGEAAAAEMQRYADSAGAYQKAIQDYQQGNQQYDEKIQELGIRASRLKAAGKDASATLSEMRSLRKPEPPRPPERYVVPPSEIQQAFILNLAPGTYRIRLRNPDGTIMEGTEKRLVVHQRRRTGGVGFEVIPSDKWTRPVESRTPSSVIYVNGSADIYLRPFFEDEFNDLAYEKTVNNAARGNANIVKWVRIQQVPRARIAVQSGESSILKETPYTVQQSQGSSLGYTIIPYDPQGAGKGRDPDLIAFRLPVARRTPVVLIRALGGDGLLLPGGDRQIRVVATPRLAVLTLLIAILPLLAMVLVLVRRAAGPSENDSRANLP